MPPVAGEWSGKCREVGKLGGEPGFPGTQLQPRLLEHPYPPRDRTGKSESAFEALHSNSVILNLGTAPSSGEGGRYFVKVDMGGVPVTALVDSGCSHTACASEKFYEIQKAGNYLRPLNLQARVANGGFAEVTGVTLLRLTIGDQSWRGDVLMVKRLPYDLIIGLNTLREMATVIDFGLDTIEFKNSTGPQSLVVNALDLRAVDTFPEEDLEEVWVENDGEHQDQEFDHPTVNTDQAVVFNDLLRYWKKEFQSSPGKCTLVEHRIYLKEASPPIKQRYIPMSPKVTEFVHAEVERLLSKGIISPSDSPWSSPIVIAPKADGSLRLCVDYRRINQLSKTDAYPLPRIHELIDTLRNANFVTKLDLISGYHQVAVAEDSKPLTAFTVPGMGLFQYDYAPFGLSSMPATFQRLMEKILRPAQKFALVYLDDILCFSRTFEEHLDHVNQVFQLLRGADLQINWKKSLFLQAETTYLGYIIGGGNLRVSPEKISAIQRYPRPKNVKDVRSFLGMCGWFRRWIEGYARITTPLTSLLKKNVRFQWSDEAEASFCELRNRLMQAPILACPDFEKEFEIHCDASDLAVGACLMQQYPDGPRAVAYTSKTLSKAQRNYSTTEKECLSLITAIAAWRYYIYGSHFVVYTDHAALSWLRGLSDPSGRLCRWVVTLSQYDMKICHRPGKSMVVPDALSRVQLNFISTPLPDFSNIQDPWYLGLRQKVQQKPSQYPQFQIKGDLLYKMVRDRVTQTVGLRLLVPTEFRQGLLENAHSSLPSGHMGMARTLKKLASQYYWPKMQVTVRRFVRTCTECQAYKARNTAPQGLMQVHEPCLSPGMMWSSDILGPLPRSKGGHAYIVLFIDSCTKWCVAVPLKTATAKTVRDALLNHVIAHHGVMETLLVDNGAQYVSGVFRKFCSDYKIKIHYLPRYYACANPTERHIRTLKTSLAIYAKESHRDWHIHLPYVVFALRTTVSEATGFTPARLTYGRELRSFYELAATSDQSDLSPFDPITYDGQLSSDLNTIYQRVRTIVRKAKQRQATTYNLRRRDVQFKPQELVWKKNFPKSSAVDQVTAKLFPKWEGPFSVKTVLSPTQVELSKLNGEDAGRWHVSHLKPVLT